MGEKTTEPFPRAHTTSNRQLKTNGSEGDEGGIRRLADLDKWNNSSCRRAKRDEWPRGDNVLIRQTGCWESEEFLVNNKMITGAEGTNEGAERPCTGL